jgi:hypothetical protein
VEEWVVETEEKRGIVGVFIGEEERDKGERGEGRGKKGEKKRGEGGDATAAS